MQVVCANKVIKNGPIGPSSASIGHTAQDLFFFAVPATRTGAEPIAAAVLDPTSIVGAGSAGSLAGIRIVLVAIS